MPPAATTTATAARAPYAAAACPTAAAVNRTTPSMVAARSAVPSRSGYATCVRTAAAASATGTAGSDGPAGWA